jgi:hypothetical protein
VWQQDKMLKTVCMCMMLVLIYFNFEKAWSKLQKKSILLEFEWLFSIIRLTIVIGDADSVNI